MVNEDEKPNLQEEAPSEGPPISPSVLEWSKKVLENSMRMEVDEEYRKEIAKRIR
ncbi:hypothetical protein QTI33_34715 [Variovorax sp. J22P271]|uniref:hypothetical protein n=1 Tax=Variovorax davisae TaxID=3053515 RepID=UPI002574D336|nr:hypothetical protein [Variovorax sp. J22P271]MDM0037322.1 hypothetical protein [Variovorax sp. J22P271]